MPTNHSNTNCVITILIHSAKMHVQNIFVFVTTSRCLGHEAISASYDFDTRTCQVSLLGRLPLFDPISLLNIHLPPKKWESPSF